MVQIFTDFPTGSKQKDNKKVLLHERKRHTACHIASLGGGGTYLGVLPHLGRGGNYLGWGGYLPWPGEYPPWPGVHTLAGGTHPGHWGYPPRPGWGTPPPL